MSNQIQRHTDTSPSVLRFGRSYDEVMALLVDAREYAATTKTDPERLGLEKVDRLTVTCEALRVTSRLGHCLAWLLIQRVIEEGELPAEAAAYPENRIPEEPVCVCRGHEEDPRMPGRLRSLLHESRSMYERLTRLERQVAEANRLT